VLSFADDAIVFVPSVKGLQQLLYICSKFAFTHNYQQDFPQDSICRYFVYCGQKWVFRPARAIRCTDKCEICHGKRTVGLSPC